MQCAAIGKVRAGDDDQVSCADASCRRQIGKAVEAGCTGGRRRDQLITGVEDTIAIRGCRTLSGHEWR